MANLRIRTQLAQPANRSKHNALNVASANPLNAYPHALITALYIHNDPFNDLADDLFALGVCGG
ncbi:hypothetical protein KSC_105760 [Ktedonobacter sp. SOSP1-52]|nr:hypothetical protein KSC_105760 [Ktedonobacter sp. SOSP1-52]